MSDELSADLRSLLSALASSPSWPLEAATPRIAPGDHIGRYRLERVIGQGGFGVVFAALDEELDRRVAVKLTRGEPSADALARFRREAQLAARLNHPNIVTLHDFGTISGLPYLILELLDGETLQDRLMRGALSPAVALPMIADVLGALGHAHAAGITHLDLKPSNVFLTSDGRVKVLDFGLAQLRGGPAAHDGGDRRAGTPAYMAPEQWRGAEPDARADVFSAGVMLFAMVSGAMPFRSHDQGADIKSDAPAPPLAAGDPPLRAIVARALEKDPARRFANAEEMLRAVAPLTRPPSRRRRLLLAAGLAVALSLVLGVVAFRARSTAVADARSAAHAASEAQAIEAQLRYARLQPLHDLAPDEAATRARLSALTLEVNRLGDVGEGAAELALGRGLLALGDLDAARAHLETAWRHGYRTAEVRAALGHALLALYSDRMAAARRNIDSERRAQLIAKLARELRDPALEHLRASDQGTPFVQAQIALHEQRYDDARKLAREALSAAPGLYEAHAIIGDTHMAEAFAAEEHGQWQGEIDRARLAGEAYQAAIAIARSDPAMYVADCHRWSREEWAMFSIGKDGSSAFTHAQESCGRALAARPADVRATVQLAAGIELRGNELSQKGQDGRPLIAEGMRLLDDARRAHPGDVQLALYTGELASMRAYVDDAHGTDPHPSFELAQRAFAEAARLDPDGDARERAGVTSVGRAEYESAHAIDPTPTVARALQQLDTHTATNKIIVSRARLHATQAAWDAAHGKDPRASLDLAIGLFEGVRAIRPNDVMAADEEGWAWASRAEWQRENGEDSRESLDKSIACSEAVLRVDATDLDGHGNLGIELIDRAEAERRHGGDPLPLLARAQKSLERALAIDAENASVLSNLGLVRERVAQDLVAHGRDPSADLAASRRFLQRAQKIKRDDLTVLAVTCDLERIAAGWDLHRHRSPAAAFARARTACDGALELDKESAPLSLQSAELAGDVVAWKQKAGLDDKSDRARGLELLESVLKRRPQWAEAQALVSTLSR